MNPSVDPPDDADLLERAWCRRIERERFTVSPTPEDLSGDRTHGLTPAEIDAITAALGADRRLPRSARLLLSRPRIYGELLLRYAASAPRPTDRSAKRARDAIRALACREASAGADAAPARHRTHPPNRTTEAHR